MKKILTMAVVLVMSVLFMANSVFADYYSDGATLRYGSAGNSVVRLQKDLKSLGYYNYYTGGHFQSLTRQSVVRFQKDHGLYVDGIVGRETARALKAEMIVQTGKWYLGVPYVWGGAKPSGFDCSGFTQYTYLMNGIEIPKSASAQYNVGIPVSRSSLKKGDLVFFTTYKSGPSHVGIYIGGGKFINASSGQGKIVIAEMSNPYFSPRYIGARRIIR